MCQNNSRSLPGVVYVLAYRVYNKAPEGFVSFYYQKPRPEIGVRTKMWSDPFHAFKSLEDVKQWLIVQSTYIAKNILTDEPDADTTFEKEQDRLLSTIAVFKARLEEDLLEGTWDDTSICTVMGNVCTILEEVNKKELT